MPRLFRAHPCGDVLRNLLLKMKSQFLIQPLSRLVAAKEHCGAHPKFVQPTHPQFSSYSVLSACIGSSREARQAGKRQAIEATASNTRLTRTKTMGSRARVW